jgi:hypothetical protein
MKFTAKGSFGSIQYVADYLRHIGVFTPDAERCIDDLKRATRAAAEIAWPGLNPAPLSEKQAALLSRYGYRTDLTIGQASEVIAYLSDNDWSSLTSDQIYELGVGDRGIEAEAPASEAA